MKIIIINNLYYPYSQGGAETVIYHTKNAFEARGHKVRVISTKPCFNKTKANVEENTYYISSIYHHQNIIPKPLRVLIHLSYTFNMWTALKVKKIINKEKPDLIIGHNLLGISYLLPRMLAKMNIKYLQVIHDIQLLHPSGLMMYGKEGIIESFIAKIYQAINRLMYNNVKLLISPSEWLMRLYQEKGFFKCATRVVSNPMPRSLVNMEKSNNPSYRFIYVAGRVSADKGAYVLFDAFRKASKNLGKGKLELIVIGEDSAPQKTRLAIGGLDNIILVGKVENKLVLKEMLKSDCLIVPSLCYENSPTVIYEALSLNKRVLASKIGGIVEMALDDRVTLFSPGDSDDLANKIVEIIKNAPKGVAVINKYKLNDPQEYVDKLLAFLNQRG